MQIIVELPNDLIQRPNPAREALEALAIAGFRAGTLTAFQAAQLLEFGSRFEFERFLKERGIDDQAYSVADLDEDMKTLRKLDASREDRR
jgi:predicted HTH domain antitoxin